MTAEITVLYRAAGWLAVLKPSGVPTTAPESAGVRSLTDLVRETLAVGAPYVHPLSRLDVEVTGVVLFALTADAEAAARRARESGRYRRRYTALLSRAPDPPRGSWDASIGVDPRDPRKRVAGGGKAPQRARTEYITEAVGACARVVMDLATGRTHQIRVHAQHAGCPVLGDRTYGGPRHVTLPDGAVLAARRVMLHALRVEVPGTRVLVEAPVPEDFASLWAACAPA